MPHSPPLRLVRPLWGRSDSLLPLALSIGGLRHYQRIPWAQLISRCKKQKKDL
jgi:hypothetical protein